MKSYAARGPWKGEEIHSLSKFGAGGGEGEWGRGMREQDGQVRGKEREGDLGKRYLARESHYDIGEKSGVRETARNPQG